MWGAWEAENMHAQRGINNISESKSPAGVIDYLPFDLMLYRGKGGTRLGHGAGFVQVEVQAFFRERCRRYADICRGIFIVWNR